MVRFARELYQLSLRESDDRLNPIDPPAEVVEDSVYTFGELWEAKGCTPKDIKTMRRELVALCEQLKESFEREAAQGVCPRASGPGEEGMNEGERGR